MLLRAGTILNSRYEVLSTVGAGGMADVYRARDNVLKRLVAIKVLKEEYSSDANFVAKFRREAQAVGGLSHPNVVSVFDVGEQGGMYYIVMELVEGITLKKYIEKMGKMEEREAVEVAMQVAKGLEAAHEQGIIHRDVKPQNIMISREGKIKVADFGIARMVSTETITASTMGSVHYISPEQARGGACDARSDIYSLGITLYEMVTGRVPFDGESSVAVALKHVQEQIRPPKEVEPSISDNLDKIILKCTQKNPAYRYASMSALLTDFKKLIVTPDDDFVVIPTFNANDPTITISKQDSDILKVAGITASGHNWADPDDLGLTYEEGVSKAISQQEEDRQAEEKAKKTEHILSYVMLGISVLIILLIIGIIFKACAIINMKKTTAAETTKPPVTQTLPPETTPEPTTPAPTTTQAPTTTPEPTTTTEEPTTEEPTTEEPTTPEETLPPDTVELPDLVGKDLTEAMDILDALGLQMRAEQEMHSPGEGVKEFEITDQSYSPGEILLIGTPVTVWVAVYTSDSVFVPTDLASKTYEEAVTMLRNAGLSVASNTEWKYSQTIAAGRVVSSNPAIGALVPRGSVVTLTLSNGPATAKLPDILGKTQEEAEELLLKAGFDVPKYVHIEEKREDSEEYDPDTVCLVTVETDKVKKETAAGAAVNLKANIYLTLVKPVPVLPNVVGRDDLDEVIAELTEMGLQLEIKNEPASTFPVGQICWVTEEDGETEILEGTVLEKGAKVMLHVSVRVVPQDLVGKSVSDAIAMLEAVGLKYKFANGEAPKDPGKAQVEQVIPDSGVQVEDGAEITITYSVPAEVCTVSFDANGGTGGMETVTVQAGSEYTLPNCSFTAPAGMIFDKWNQGAPGTKVQINVNTKIVAQWKAAPFTVTFDANGGSGSMDPVPVSGGTAYTLPACQFTGPNGAGFKIWMVETGSNSFESSPGQSILVNSNVKVTAKWEEPVAPTTPEPTTPVPEYTVTFDANGGTGTMAQVTRTEGSEYELPACGFTAPAGKVFDTWNLGAPGTKITIDGAKTVVAQWKSVQYTVSFNANGGTGTMNSATVNAGSEYELPACGFTAPEGKEFDGWDKGAVGATIPVNGDVTVTAQWKDKQQSLVMPQYLHRNDVEAFVSELKTLTGLDDVQLKYVYREDNDFPEGEICWVCKKNGDGEEKGLDGGDPFTLDSGDKIFVYVSQGQKPTEPSSSEETTAAEETTTAAGN